VHTLLPALEEILKLRILHRAFVEDPAVPFFEEVLHKTGHMFVGDLCDGRSSTQAGRPNKGSPGLSAGLQDPSAHVTLSQAFLADT